ncbi:hypothetical protein DYE50_10410 [Treponema ruminis]|uniref:Uncharacterized protein n=1 Tax=Treponema ruminis TaxID=744515 RepID=A0A7W8LM85_9SPIR|nr:hypothetical protein [Treponema ruminis]MBB5226115.1 hypothetical protein [Treponema ruminis]QSI02976.1 hypothetical protein DYE50_10410 [Treponema ruminis]
MKKSMVLAGALLAFAAFFASAKDYEVKSFSGKVTYSESENGKAIPVKAGMTVSDETIVSLGTNSKLVLTADGKDITLRTPKKGTVAEQINAKLGMSGSVSKKGKGTATAASRASDVMAEGELDD